MGLIKDITQGPVASTNAITDHLTDNAMAKIQAFAAALAPELNIDAAQLADHITAILTTSLTGTLTNAIDETEQAGEKLVDHTAPVLVQVIHAFFACLWKTRIEIKGGD